MGRGAVETLDIYLKPYTLLYPCILGYMGRGAVETLEDLSETLYYTFILHLQSSLQREE